VVGRGLQTATTATAAAIVFKSLTTNQLVQRGPDGSAETLAIPMRAIKGASVQKDTLVIMLTSGDQVLFKSKNAKMFTVATAQIQVARDANTCPYCGQTPPPGAITCPRCGASVSGTAAPAASPAPAQTRPGGGYAGPGAVSVTLPTMTPQMMQAQCPHCRATVAVGRMCANCGKPLMVTCSQCRQDVPLWVYPGGFCPICGSKLF
jgi:predicted amidophosphoribosyltransferase